MKINIMKISQLEPGLKTKALKYRAEGRAPFDMNSDSLKKAFDWNNTEEGYNFWADIWRKSLAAAIQKTEEIKSFSFDESVKETLTTIENLLVVKGKEYRRNNDPYHNFNRGAALTGKTREEVLQGFLLKHLISVEDLRNDSKLGIFPDEAKIHEKYNDVLVYFLIEKASMLDRLSTYKAQLNACR